MTKAKRNAGHPRTIINWAKVDAYLEAGASSYQIAGALGISRMTLYLHCQEDRGMIWSEYKKQKSDAGKADLKLAQHEKAVKSKNVLMLIWLGKQRLDQYDKTSINTTSTELSIDLSSLSDEEIIMIRNNPDQKIIKDILSKKNGLRNIERIERGEVVEAEYVDLTPED